LKTFHLATLWKRTQTNLGHGRLTFAPRTNNNAAKLREKKIQKRSCFAKEVANKTKTTMTHSGLPDFFDTIHIPKWGKNTKLPLHYQMAIKYTNWPYYIPNGLIIHQPFPFRGPPKFTQIETFG
jgi:hypothetical protein